MVARVGWLPIGALPRHSVFPRPLRAFLNKLSALRWSEGSTGGSDDAEKRGAPIGNDDRAIWRRVTISIHENIRFDATTFHIAS